MLPFACTRVPPPPLRACHAPTLPCPPAHPTRRRKHAAAVHGRSRIEERVDEKEEWTPQSRWLTGASDSGGASFSALLSARSFSLPAGCLARPSPSLRKRRHRRQQLTPQHDSPAATAAVASVTPHGSLLWVLFLAFCSQRTLCGAAILHVAYFLASSAGLASSTPSSSS